MRPSILPISIVVLLAVLFSCTIQKRVYRPGYHIEWKKRLKPAEAFEEHHVFSVREPGAAVISELPAEHTDSVAETLPETEPAFSIAGKPSVVSFSTDVHKPETQVDAPKERRTVLPAFQQKQRATTASMDEVEKIFLFIVIALLLYLLIFLASLIVGLVVIDTAPVWGIVLLTIAGIMAMIPLVALIQNSIEENRERKEKARKAAEAPGAFSDTKFSPFISSGRRKRPLPSPSELIWLGILLILIFLVYIGLAVTGIVLGISLIVMGTYFWGILLLTLGSFLILCPVITLIVTNQQDKKKAAGATGAFGPPTGFNGFHKWFST